MNLFPRFPTDNLYKYAALSGWWGIVVIFVLFFISQSLESNTQKLALDKSQIVLAQTRLQHAQDRWDALSTGRASGDTISFIKSICGPKCPQMKEKIFLQNYIVWQSAQIEFVKHDMNARSNQSDFDKLMDSKNSNFYIVLIILFYIEITLCIWGFIRWQRFQKISDEIQCIDLKLKKWQLRNEGRVRFTGKK